MKKNRYAKKIGFLIIILFCVICGSKKVNAASIDSLRSKFPDGKYWNHAGNPGAGNGVNNQDGYTSTPCPQHKTVGTTKQTCNGFCPNGTQLSWQCMGYAEKLGYDTTGYNPRVNANGWVTYTNKSALNSLKPGDIVRYKNDNHSIFVTAVNGNTVTYTDCNSDNHCKIRWDQTISKTTLSASFTHLRSTPYRETQQPAIPLPSCSNLYTSQSSYALNEKVEFHIATANTNRMTIGIDKVGSGRVLTQGFDATDCYGVWASELGAGSYTAYFSLYNETGYIDTSKVEFAIIPWGEQTISDGEYHIVSALDSSKGLDIQDGSKDTKANVQLYTNTEDSKQTFQVTYLGDGSYKIINTNSEKSLDVQEMGMGNESNVWQYDYVGEPQQQWIIKETSDGWFNIISKKNSLCLEARNGCSDDGTNIQMYNDNGTPAQKWRFIAWGGNSGQTIKDGEYHIVSALDEAKGLDVAEGKKDNKVNIQLYGNVDDDKQTFNVIYLGNGYYKIINTNSGKSLDMEGEGTVKGTNIQQYDYVGEPQQQWIIKENSDGYFSIISKSTGLAVDVENGWTDDGMNIRGWIANSTKAQKWRFLSVKPQYSTITTEKENYSLADTVRLNVDSSHTAYMDVGIDKKGEGKVLTRRCDSTDGCSIDAPELGDGDYTAYFTLYSGDYNTDTEKVSFSIKKPEYSSIKVSKPIYGLSELVKFSVDSKYTDRMIIGINNSEGQRVLTEDCNSVNSYNVKAERLGIGDYTAYVTLYGTKSRWDYFIDTEKVSFSVREKAHEHEIVTIPEVPATCDKEGKTAGKQCSTCGEIIEEPKIIEKLDHKYDNGKVTQKPTCTKKGVKTYTCEHCKKTKTEDIPATGHQKRDVRNKKEVTCEIDGYSGDEYCSDCGELLKKGTIITAIGHDWNKGEITKKATCTEAGERTYTCKSCSNKRVEIVPETGHLEIEVRNKKEATCEQNGYTGDTCCTVCGTILEKGEAISALGHNWNQGEITKEATETEEGIKTYTCQTCKKTETEVIPVKKHNWDKGAIIKQPTCTEDGERIYTCTDAGCNKTYTEKVPAIGHQQIEIRNKKEATCEEDGYTGDEYCTKCKELLKKGQTIFALDHNWNNGEIVKEASCIESGEKVYTCARCKKTKIGIIPAKGHADTEKKREKEVTCEENGYTGDECCKECGAVLKKGQIIPALGHNWDKGTVSKEPSVTEEGIREYKCLNVGCQETKTEKIAKLPKPEEPSTEPENPSTEPTKPSTDETKPSKDNKIPATEDPKKNTETTQKPLKVGTKITDKKSKAVYKVTGKNTVQYIKSTVKNVKTVNIPAAITVNKVKYQVTSIAAKAVKGNKKLTKVVIPASIRSIGAQAFAGCKNLKNITIKTSYLTKKNVGAGAFKGISAKAVIKVSKKQFKAYQKMLISKGVSKKAKIKK